MLLAFLSMTVFWTGVVNKPVANLYSNATTQADVVSQALLGSEVAVLEERDDFARVRTADEYTGWIVRSALGAARPLQGRAARVANLFANVYRDKSITRNEPVLVAPYDARLEVIGDVEDERWYRVRLPDWREGWVQRGDLAFESAPVSTTDMLELSRRFLGLPYLWGVT